LCLQIKIFPTKTGAQILPRIYLPANRISLLCVRRLLFKKVHHITTAIPVEKDGKTLHEHFGRASTFAVVGDSTTLVDNPGKDLSGGAGIKAAQAVIDTGADSLITISCGKNALEVFASANVKVYSAIPGDVKTNMAALIAGNLKPFSETEGKN